MLDWFGTEYVLVAGASVPVQRWRDAAHKIVDDTGFPLAVRCFDDIETPVYDASGLVLVRPDGIIADCWHDQDADAGDAKARISRLLPLQRA